MKQWNRSKIYVYFGTGNCRDIEVIWACFQKSGYLLSENMHKLILCVGAQIGRSSFDVALVVSNLQRRVLISPRPGIGSRVLGTADILALLLLSPSTGFYPTLWQYIFRLLLSCYYSDKHLLLPCNLVVAYWYWHWWFYWPCPTRI